MKQLIIKGDNGCADASIEDIVAARLNYFKGWNCAAGTQNLYIDFDGRVWVANCASSYAQQTVKLKDKILPWGYLGMIGQSFTIPKNNVICPFDSCGCGSDIVTTKYQVGKDIKLFLDKEFQFPDISFPELKNFSALKVNYAMPKQILWDVGRFCNYNCSYCWPGVHNTTDPHKSLSLFRQTADYLIDNWATGSQIRWYFGGGEPTLNPDFEPFVDYLASKNQWIMLVSNGSQGPAYWAKNADNYDTLIFSAHFEFMKPNLFAKNFNQVLKVLNNNPKRLNRYIVKLMTKPGEVDRSIKFVEELKAETEFSQLSSWAVDKLSFDMVPLRDIVDGSKLHTDYTEQELQDILKFNTGK